MIYLASPYSHRDPTVREQRFHEACRATAALQRAGNAVVSPIVHGHPLVAHGLPTDWAFWQRWGHHLLMRCDAVIVLQLDGWIDSVGVQAEIALARRFAIPLQFVEPSLVSAWQAPVLAHVATEVVT